MNKITQPGFDKFNKYMSSGVKSTYKTYGYCWCCKIEKSRLLHHISYFPEWLVPLCFSCHQRYHKFVVSFKNYVYTYDGYKNIGLGAQKFFWATFMLRKGFDYNR